jgi:hypothetical protein
VTGPETIHHGGQADGHGGVKAKISLKANSEPPTQNTTELKGDVQSAGDHNREHRLPQGPGHLHAPLVVGSDPEGWKCHPLLKMSSNTTESRASQRPIESNVNDGVILYIC